MKNMTLGNIADACGGIYHGTEAAKEKTIAEITTDSRKAGKDACLWQLREKGWMPISLSRPYLNRGHCV